MTRVTTAVRLKVRERAGGRCEYCRKPERLSTHSHHTDHIIPVKRHGGSPEFDNLAWACFECNTNKGGDVASYDTETGELAPLFNPRTQKWDEHFEMEGALIIAKTAIGRVTVRVLEMNHANQLQAREMLMKAGLW
jgi:hypothetical protein